MGLAVVYDGLFIAVEGQSTHLVGDLLRWTERKRKNRKETREQKEIQREKKTLAMLVLSKLYQYKLIMYKSLVS